MLPFTTSIEPIFKGALVTIPSTSRICIAVARAVSWASSAEIWVCPVRATQPKSSSLEAFVSVLGNTEISVSVANGASASSCWQEKKSPAIV